MYGPHSLVQLENGENVILQIRRHLFVFYMRIAFVVVLVFLPLLLIPVADAALEKIFDANGILVFWALYLMWLLVLSTILFVQWTDYYLDVWIVTNKRVIDIEQKGVFNFEVSTFRLEQIQDISIEINGIIASFLKFGTIHIHTAGESPNLTIRDAARPIEVKEALMRAHGAVMDARNGALSRAAV